MTPGLTSVTATPGTTAPDASWTVPLMVPVVSCAAAEIGRSSVRINVVIGVTHRLAITYPTYSRTSRAPRRTHAVATCAATLLELVKHSQPNHARRQDGCWRQKLLLVDERARWIAPFTNADSARQRAHGPRGIRIREIVGIQQQFDIAP